MGEGDKNTVFLAKRGRFFFRKSPREIDETMSVRYLACEGYRLATRMRFSGRASGSRVRWVVDHVRELAQLIQQIGLINTLRALRYAASPKVLYVDAVKVVDETTHEESTFYSEYGIPLAASYTKALLKTYGCSETAIQPESVVKTYRIEEINSSAVEMQRGPRKSGGSTSRAAVGPRSTRTRWIVAGAGNFCATVLVPSILNAGGKIVGVCSNIGASAETLARAFNIDETFESFEEMLGSGVRADNLLIATPPYLHPVHLRAGIEANYRIYCEKPAAVDRQGLDLIRDYSSYENCMIGFNRRFIPAIQYLINSPAYRECGGPKMITYVVNLGEFSVAMAKKHLGGGTTVGSCCHYLDLIEFIAGCRIRDFTLQRYPDVNDGLVHGGSFSCVCSLEDGSVATLVFVRTERPIKGLKEQICIAGAGLNAVVNDFSDVLVNGAHRRFLFGTKGWQLAMRHFHGDDSLAASDLTPTLADGIHICELTLAIDEALEADTGSGSVGCGHVRAAGRS